ncbi:hypothetical protein C7974DRAFT_135175 [Boeremia exigua]|uniref:uncharacterized protein n=1 Tax=Boeremia exigua TaxID=749465 RepID=UPI001E8D919C|nr:uncharacterized protein C7974DRAFT_135175 [Boeremia exigua]KAH6639607.1 hypothetical protein C7974DRAFT_135175 [Boeremia exigua]
MSSSIVASLQFVLLFLAVCTYVVYLILQRPQPRSPTQELGARLGRDRSEDPKIQNEASFALSKLVHYDGAGTWPPRTDHINWPPALIPYRNTYFEMVPLLSSAAASLDDDTNIRIRNDFRIKMRTLLKQSINIQEVERIMVAAEMASPQSLSRSAYNGFYNCVAVCRHMYRWATIPVVKVAQAETVIEFPPELDAPWSYLQRSFGVTAMSGNNTSNVLLNFDERGERVFRINVRMSKLIQSSEEAFFQMFYDVELAATPIYYDMINAITSFESKDNTSCLRYLENINSNIRNVFQVFYDNLNESKVSQSVWLSYVQGFQGWGVGKIVDGKFIKYDGLSGNHVLIFQALDAFLGLDRYLTDEDMVRYIPVNQRNLCLALKKNCLRSKIQGNQALENIFAEIVKKLKVFRTAHRTRVMSYLKQPAPERSQMTAGKSVLEGTQAQGLQRLDDFMAKRLKQTV